MNTSRKPPMTAKEKAIERYRLLRLNKAHKNKASITRRTRVKPKRITPTKPKIVWVDIKEQEIEIEQNLTFYCMENRKDSRFDDNMDCSAYTENIYSECRNDFVAGDARLTRCVKSRLNK